MRDHEPLPPQNLEAELGVLGSILLDSRTLHDVIPILRASDFYRDTHQAIYGIIEDFYAANRTIDLITLNEELVRRKLFDYVGGNTTLVALVESVPHAVHGLYYADLVRQKSIGRDYIEVASQILRDAYANQFSAEELAERAESSVLAVGKSRDRAELTTVQAVADQALQLADRQIEGTLVGCPSGLAALEEMIGSFQPGHLVIVAARPSIGKSALALGFAKAIARRRPRQVLFVSLEMTGPELGARVLSAEAEVDGYLLKRAKDYLDDVDRAALDQARRTIDPWKILIDDSCRRTVAGIASHARRLHHRGGLEAVFVDYLQLVDPDPALRRNPRHEQVAAMSRDLKHLATELGVPVIVCCQVNRESEREQGRGKDAKVKPPKLSHLRESGAIEQDANIVLLLHRPEHYNPEDRPGEADLIVAKNRDGATGTIRLQYEKHLTRFRDPNDLPPLDSAF